MPQAKLFLYADNTLVWVEGSPTEVQAAVKRMKDIMQEYGDHTGQRLNRLQVRSHTARGLGPTAHQTCGRNSSGAVCTLPGMASREYGSIRPVRGCKAQQLGTLPLTDTEKVAALTTWAYPVFDVVDKLVYPVQQVRTRVDSIAQHSLKMANWSMTDAINMQPEDKGGIGMILPSQYLRFLHSKRYVYLIKNPDTLTGAQLRSFEEWKGDQLQDKLSRKHINWSKEPVRKADGESGRPWLGMATAAKAHEELRPKMAGLHEPKESVTRPPLWNTAIFQRETGATYQCPALLRRGILRVGDLLKDGGLDEAKLAPIAATW